VSTYAERLREAGLAPHTLAGRLEQLGSAMRALAAGKNLAWVELATSRLRGAATPVRDMTMGMQPAEGILKLGLDMMHAAETDRSRTVTDRATLFRDGLLLALAISRPIRRANLGSIAIGGQLRQRADGWWLVFEKTEMKTPRPCACSWPPELEVNLKRYLDVHRGVLLKCSRKALPASNALWISQHGTPMTTSAIYLQVKTRTADAFGAQGAAFHREGGPPGVHRTCAYARSARRSSHKFDHAGQDRPFRKCAAGSSDERR